MAYDDIHCPCGGKKLTGTMLCGVCMDHLANYPEMRMIQDTTLAVNSRRSAAIILLSLARKRTLLRRHLATAAS